MRCGLLGEKLGHSYSPELHAFFGNYDYELFEVPPDQLGDFIRARDFQGLNVTIPYKTTMLAICDDLTEAAAAIGSVNTVVKQLDGSLLGDNTDAAGFEGMVWKSRMRILGRKCLVLGSGGASLSVQYVLRKLGAGEIVVISRTGEDNYTNLDRHRDASILVNTTPVGMYPNTAASPVDLREFPQCEGVLDLIYNPARTALLRRRRHWGFPVWAGCICWRNRPGAPPRFLRERSSRHPHQGGLPRPEPPEGEPNPDRYARLWEEHRGAGAGPAPGPAVCGL